jgi:Ca2+-binding RTX toxin-like protein
VTGGVLNASGVSAGNSTLNLVVTDAAGYSLTKTFNVWIGGSGADSMAFLSANDVIGDGLVGNDGLTGGNEVDYLIGGNGDDTLRGNGGADQLVGSGGNDHFVYGALADSNLTTFDTILDFNRNQDSLDFLNSLGLTTILPADFGAATTLAAHTVGWHYDGTNTIAYANLGGSSESITSGSDMMKVVLSGVTNLVSSSINIHA